MALQTTYNRYQPKAQAGMPATMHGWDADTRNVPLEADPIPFGRVVSKGPGADDDVVLGGTLYAGVSIRDTTLVHDTADQYEEGDNISVLVRGDIWVLAEDAVVAKTAIVYNTTTGALGSSGGTAIPGSVWMTSADAGGLAIARLTAAMGDVTT